MVGRSLLRCAPAGGGFVAGAIGAAVDDPGAGLDDDSSAAPIAAKKDN